MVSSTRNPAGWHEVWNRVRCLVSRYVIYFSVAEFPSVSLVSDVGCILAELLGRKPLWPGKGTLNQLSRIFSVVGTPDDTYTNLIARPAAQRWIQRQTWKPKISFRELYPHANGQALDLLDQVNLQIFIYILTYSYIDIFIHLFIY